MNWALSLAPAILFAMGSAACSALPPPTVSMDSPDPPDRVEFHGTIVEEGPDVVRLVDPKDPGSIIRVPKELVTTGPDGKVFLRVVKSGTGESANKISREPSSVPYAAGASGDSPSAEPSRPHIKAECRGVVRFQCNDDQTSVPIGVCFGIHGCRDEEL